MQGLIYNHLDVHCCISPVVVYYLTLTAVLAQVPNKQQKTKNKALNHELRVFAQNQYKCLESEHQFNIYRAMGIQILPVERRYKQRTIS